MGENNGMNKRILIAGGSGFIGSSLAKELKLKGYEVAILTRNIHSVKGFEPYYWDIAKGEIQENAFKNVDCIINLAGENISNGRWTESQKIKIEESRVKSAELIFGAVQKLEKKPESYISASATGYYGTFNSDKIFSETDQAGDDFLAGICQKWEDAASKFQTPGIRTTIFRTGVVFSGQAGAFPQLIQTLKFGFISAIGSGRQYMPWIHIDDLVKMYLFAIENDGLQGIYNAVAPEHISQTELVKKIRHISGKRLKTPNIPGFLLKAIFGEMASILLYGSRVSADKILKTGFEFNYPNIDLALKSMLK
jgi:uncharacterized protein